MSRTPKALRALVAADAMGRCGYCQTQEKYIGSELEIDHLRPRSAGGPTERKNLWLACSLCNDTRNKRISGTDPETGDQARLFNPRFDNWHEHFFWTDNGTVVFGITPIGRATVATLKLNDGRRVDTRREWVRVGWHPPKD